MQETRLVKDDSKSSAKQVDLYRFRRSFLQEVDLFGTNSKASIVSPPVASKKTVAPVAAPQKPDERPHVIQKPTAPIKKKPAGLFDLEDDDFSAFETTSSVSKAQEKADEEDRLIR